MLTTPATVFDDRDPHTASHGTHSASDDYDAPVVHGGRRRRHGAGLAFDREELERSGWRTTLEYRENHVRRRDGRLDHLEVVWHAEAERTLDDGSLVVVAASAHSAAKAWGALRREADLAAFRGSPPARAEWSRPRRRGVRGERIRRHATH